MINLKFIGTKIDNNNCIMSMTTCNLCPFFDINPKTKKSFCSKEKTIKKLIVPTYSFLYRDGYYYPLLDIYIPEWCELDKFSTDVLSHKEIIYLKSGEVTHDIIDSFNGFDIISHRLVKYNGCKLVTDPKKIVNGYNYQYVPLEDIKNYCSFCGQDKSDVDRLKNFGMCESCIELTKNDEIKLNQAYINNFRLKRKSTYSEFNFKKVCSNINLK